MCVCEAKCWFALEPFWKLSYYYDRKACCTSILSLRMYVALCCLCVYIFLFVGLKMRKSMQLPRASSKNTSFRMRRKCILFSVWISLWKLYATSLACPAAVYLNLIFVWLFFSSLCTAFVRSIMTYPLHSSLNNLRFDAYRVHGDQMQGAVIILSNQDESVHTVQRTLSSSTLYMTRAKRDCIFFLSVRFL